MQWHGPERFQAIQKAAAQGLLRAALLFEVQHSLRVSKPNPPPYVDSSKRGEYPKLRTGAGRSGLTHVPATVEEVMRTGSVRVGFVQGRHHLLHLELSQRFGRLGLQRTLSDLRGPLAAVATAGFKQ